MKNRIFYLSIILVILFINNLYSEFSPWNSEVKTGDELNILHTDKKKNARILNGAQGGAYFLVRFFQVVISPQDGPNCRHTPTCSAYGKQAVIKYGAFAGSVLAGERLLRCNPFYPPEKDPVPDRIFGK